jgi:hypothetical protein
MLLGILTDARSRPGFASQPTPALKLSAANTLGILADTRSRPGGQRGRGPCLSRSYGKGVETISAVKHLHLSIPMARGAPWIYKK